MSFRERGIIDRMEDGTYHVQFVCATPGSYEISAFVDGNKLPMCRGPGDCKA